MKKIIKNNFVHLHNHTQYSLMNGISRVRDLVEHAVKLKMKHIAITDHGNMSGVPTFLLNCKAYGINPIVGCEIQVKRDSNEYNNLVVLVKNYEGYKNLIKLSSYGYIKTEHHKPIVDIEYLRTHSNGIICLSGGMKGEISGLLLSEDTEEAKKVALEYQEIFGKGNFYLEVEDYGISEEKIVTKYIVRLSKKTAIPVVAANDTYYINREDAEAQYVQRCLADGRKYDKKYLVQPGYSEYSIKSQEEMTSVFSDMSEALTNTLEIAKRCNLTIDLPGPELPDFEVPPQFLNANEYLRHLAIKGLMNRYKSITREIQKRFDYELEIIKYISEKYGHDQVGGISQFKFRDTKSVILDIANTLDIPDSDKNLISKLFPEEFYLPIQLAIDKEPGLIDLKQKNDKLQKLFDISRRLDRLYSFRTIHERYIVIGKRSLANLVPLYKDTGTGLLPVQYEGHYRLEENGFVLFELFGMESLSFIRKVVDLIRKKNPGFSIKNIPTDDKATLNIFRKGNTKDIFEFQSPEMQKFLRQMSPDSIEDLLVLNALHYSFFWQYIPGLIDRKNGSLEITYPAPKPGKDTKVNIWSNCLSGTIYGSSQSGKQVLTGESRYFA